MADAKYVVGDHRNGDAKIELDANKKQFTGLTKEELLKYAEDPFWVRLRWAMFVLFWALWGCMLAGAIIIIVHAPKCPPPPPKQWFEKGPLVDVSSIQDYSMIESKLPALQQSKVQGIFAFTCKDTFEVIETPGCLDRFQAFVAKAKTFGVKVIAELTANFVSSSHIWFQKSENRSAGYEDYFVWAKGSDHDEKLGRPALPNNWVSTENTEAWTWSPIRQEYYLNLFGADQPTLNYANPAVVKQMDTVIRLWMKAGADGIRLKEARHLLVNQSLANEDPHTGQTSIGADHTQYNFWMHRHTTDQPALDQLLAHWSYIIDQAGNPPDAGATVFTLAEEAEMAELYLLDRNTSMLRPPSAAAINVDRDAKAAAAVIRARVHSKWPMMQLYSSESYSELLGLAMLLPAAPILDIQQLRQDNDTDSDFGRLVSLRSDASIEHGLYNVSAVPANGTDDMIACARWKLGHTGYVAVFNPTNVTGTADVSSMPSISATLTLHYAEQANFTINQEVSSSSVFVPAKSTVVLSYVPKTAVEK